MRRPALAVLLLLAASLALTACDTGGPDPIGLTGTWEGVIIDRNDASVTYPVEFRITDTGQRITGAGEYRLPNETVEFAVVNGSFIDFIVRLELQFGLPPFTGSLDGELTQTDPGQIKGTFSGRGAGNGRVEIELVARRVS